MRILVIEDEQKLGNALQEGLEAEQYGVALAPTGEEGFYLSQTEAFDLVVLDVMLPGRNGLEILATMRRQGVKTPILLLTARDAIEDRIRGLDAGADDYLVKPFAFPELLARIRALGRRGLPEIRPKLQRRDLEMDVVGRTAHAERPVAGSDPARVRAAGISGPQPRPRRVARDADAGRVEGSRTSYASWTMSSTCT